MTEQTEQTEQAPTGNGTVAQEAARLIETLTLMARSTADWGLGTNADGPTRDSAPDAHDDAPDHDHRDDKGDEPSEGVCSACGGERESTPVACKLCPLCQGIAFIRSVRPETVDRLADLASVVASSLRDLAAQSRGSAPGSGEGPASGSGSGSGRAPVQDIHVDDEDQG
ncbi:MAG: hypothetical protein ABI438_00210 [Dermatophilaceae bacterium]